MGEAMGLLVDYTYEGLWVAAKLTPSKMAASTFQKTN